MKKKADIDLVEADREFRTLKYATKDNVESNPLIFWIKVKNMGEFENVVKLVEFILTLPHSSAACERVFSVVNNNKTKTRNRLDIETLNGILLSKGVLSMTNKNCYDFDVSKMIHLHNSQMYGQ